MKRFAFLVTVIAFLVMVLVGCRGENPVETKAPKPEFNGQTNDWTLHHSPSRPLPARSLTKTAEREAGLGADLVVPGNEFSVAGIGAWPVPNCDHFHSSDAMVMPSVSLNDLEVGSFFGSEECRGMTEFDLTGLPAVTSASLEVEVVLLGGLYGQSFGDFNVEVFSYDANNVEEITDYELASTFSLGTFTTTGLSVGDILSFDVTAAYKDAYNRNVAALGVRLQPISNPATSAVVFANSFLLLTVNEPPDCSNAVASVEKLWPPNHKMVEVDILGVVDPEGDPVSITITGITQDEALNGLGDGSTQPDGMGVGTSTASVRAERSGLGNGRVYEIWFTASDGNGGECMGSVSVCVPHDKNDDCVDDGQLYDSTAMAAPMDRKQLEPLVN